MLTVVYPIIKVRSGTKTYVDTVLTGLEKINYPFKPIGIRKMEFSFLGEPVGGIASQRFGTMLHRGLDHPVHALAPEVSPKDVDVVTIHDIIPFLKREEFIKTGYDKSAYNMMFGRALNSRILLVSTKVVKQELINALGLDDARVRVVYQGIDSSKFYRDEANLFPENGKIHLVTMGDYNPRKRFDILYDIVSRNKEYELYHIGPINSWKERANRLIDFAKKAGNIFPVGEVDDATLRRYLSNADLFVYISEAEGFGLPPLEAMACGTNVLLNALPIFRETVGDYGFLSELERFDESIGVALRNRKGPETLRNRAVQFSIEKEINDLVSIYGELDLEK
ncbi:MAG: glycosyltransferase [Thermoplasmata archaeon]